MDFFIYLVVIVLFVYFQSKVSKLEQDLSSKNKKNLYLESPSALKDSEDVSLRNEEVTVSQNKVTIESVHENSAFTNFIVWFSKDWILKLGAFFILLGFIWLVTYAFINNYIGYQGRILLGLTSGALVLFYGNLRLKKQVGQGVVLLALGASIMIISTYAAQHMYHMFNYSVALTLILLVVIVLGFNSILNNSRSLVVLSALPAFLAPILTSEGDASVLNLLSFVFVISAGFLWITFYKNWRFVFILCAVFAFSYSVLAYVNSGISSTLLNSVTTYSRDLLILRFFALSFISLFFFASVGIIIISKKLEHVDYLSSSIVTIFIIYYIFTLLPKDYHFIFLVFASVLLLSASVYVFNVFSNLSFVRSYSIPACFLLVIATFVQFSGAILLIFLCVEALFVPLFLNYLYKNESADYFALFSVPVMYQSVETITKLYSRKLVYYYSDTGNLQVPDQNMELLGLLVVVIYLFGVSLYFLNKISKSKSALYYTKIYFVFFGIYLTIFNWVFVDVLFNNTNVTSILNLIIMSVAGLILYFYSFAKKSLYLKYYGIVLLILVIARLFMVEIWQMDVLYRIITFFGVGVIFVTSVLLPKKLLFKSNETP